MKITSMVKVKIDELIKYRHVASALIKRNIEGKYKNSFLGIGWQFLTPLITIILFYVLYTGIMQREVDNYWLYLCSGMFVFYFIQNNIQTGCMCFAGNSSLINKMYFPRELLVISQVVSAFIIMCIGYSIVFVLIIVNGCTINVLAMMLLVPIVFLVVLLAFGIVFLFASIVVYVRDLHHILDAFTRVFFWLTPVFYILDDTKNSLAMIAKYNPLTYYVECFHEIIYWSTVPSVTNIVICTVFSLIIFFVGYAVFIKLKKGFSERV